MGPTGASAESTERDQLGGQRNARDADGAIVTTDRPGARQHLHTADYWLHIYTHLGLCLHIHTDFRAATITCEGVLTSALVLTRVGVESVHFDRGFSLFVLLPHVQLRLLFRKILMIVCLFFCAQCAAIIW